MCPRRNPPEGGFAGKRMPAPPMSAPYNTSLCLEMVFRDRPFLDRMREARRLGYEAIEFWDWRDKDIGAIDREAQRLALTITALSGNRMHSLIDPCDREGLLAEMEEVFAVARRLRCTRVMLLSDV